MKKDAIPPIGVVRLSDHEELHDVDLIANYFSKIQTLHTMSSTDDRKEQPISFRDQEHRRFDPHLDQWTRFKFPRPLRSLISAYAYEPRLEFRYELAGAEQPRVKRRVKMNRLLAFSWPCRITAGSKDMLYICDGQSVSALLLVRSSSTLLDKDKEAGKGNRLKLVWRRQWFGNYMHTDGASIIAADMPAHNHVPSSSYAE